MAGRRTTQKSVGIASKPLKCILAGCCKGLNEPRLLVPVPAPAARSGRAGHQLAELALLSRSCWAGYFSLLCYRSCTVTHTLWVGLMDAFFLCLLLTLVPGGFSQAMQGGTVPGSAAWLGAFPASLCFSRLRLASSC